MPLLIRPATSADADALGRMGAALAGLHHTFDPRRFMLPEGIEVGYARWLRGELRHETVVVIVAEQEGRVVGYAYGRIEERDWVALRDTCAVWHDLWVEEDARGSGVGRRLGEELIRRLQALGAPRIVLMTASVNETAQRLFGQLGFAPTMVEMTKELPSASP